MGDVLGNDGRERSALGAALGLEGGAVLRGVVRGGEREVSGGNDGTQSFRGRGREVQESSAHGAVLHVADVGGLGCGAVIRRRRARGGGLLRVRWLRLLVDRLRLQRLLRGPPRR